MYKKNLNTLKN